MLKKSPRFATYFTKPQIEGAVKMSVVKSGLLRKGWCYIVNRVKCYIYMEESKPLARRDILSDRLLLAYVIYKARAHDLGRTKIQKLVYFVQSELGEQSIRTFDYDFEKWYWGPYAKDMSDDLKELRACNVISAKLSHRSRNRDSIFGRTNEFYHITENGKEIIEESRELFDENRELMQRIDEILRKYDRLSLGHIEKDVHHRKVNFGRRTAMIADLRDGSKLNVRVTDAKNKLQMDDDWRETFCILFDRDECRAHNEALRDAREGRCSPCDMGVDGL